MTEALRQRILTAAGGEDGALFADIAQACPEWSQTAISSSIVRMTNVGALFFREERPRVRRYFTSDAAAAAWQARVAAGQWQPPPVTTRDKMVACCRTSGGATTRQIADALRMTRQSVRSHLSALLGKRLHGARGDDGLTRYFASREDAQALKAAAAQASASPKLHDIREPIKSTAHNRPGAAITLAPSFPVRRKGEARPAPVTIIRDTRRPEGEAQVPAHVLPAYGVAAGYDPRYQVGPGEEVPSFYRAVPLGAAHMLPGVR